MDEKFLKLYYALKDITNFQTPGQLRRKSRTDWGLDYHEALEMSYENIQQIAKQAIKGIKIK